MKKLFYIGIIELTLFEILKVYFIMPFPGSQRMNSIDFAYFLHTYRWHFRIILATLAVAGSLKAFQAEKKLWPAITAAICLFIIYNFNFKMTADHMFLEPTNLVFKSKSGNELGDTSLVLSVKIANEVKAYPIQFIAYHHKVQDTIGSQPVLITYCNVCRTGRAFEPYVDGEIEHFRLVGMDHFNAMLEDSRTGSWWRQANGEAITGKLKGTKLEEIESTQLTVGKLFELYPNALVMQADAEFMDSYDSLARFERGKSESDLTRTDTLSWQDKSWVVGIDISGKAKAYDWNALKANGMIEDTFAGKALVLVLSRDGQSFGVFEKGGPEPARLSNDTIFIDSNAFDLSGRSLADSIPDLKRIAAYQEFWHSWRTFHPQTARMQP